MPERRRKTRKPTSEGGQIHVSIERADGVLQTRGAKLVDVSDWGVGVETSSPMVVGTLVSVWGPSVPGAPGAEERRRVKVVHCRVTEEGLYRAGCAFEDAPKVSRERPAAAEAPLADHYETLQISPSADPETIHRVYRHLAQRYHPDNQETGDARAFQALLQAYQVLSDPARRAGYDAQYLNSKSLHWQVFEKPNDSQDLDSEARMRAAVLAALYVKRRHHPEGSGLMTRDLEQLLNCPREHLEFVLWYLRSKAWIAGPNQGRYEITWQGVEAAEQYQREGLYPKATANRQLAAGPQAAASAESTAEEPAVQAG